MTIQKLAFYDGVPHLEIFDRPGTLKSFMNFRKEVQVTCSFMIKTKILQFFICYKTSFLKVPKYLVTGFCKVFYQLCKHFYQSTAFQLPQDSRFGPNYYAKSLVRFFITRFQSSANERVAFQSSLLKLEYVCCFVFLLYLKIFLGMDSH